MGIEPDKSGYYRVTFSHGGRQYSVRSKKSHADAVRRAALKQDGMERGEIGVSGAMTVRAWAAEYMEVYRRNAVGDAVQKAEQGRLDNVVLPAIGAMRLVDVTPVHCQRVLNSRAGMSRSEIAKTRTLLSSLFSRAQRARLIPHSPAEGLDTPDGGEGGHRQITPEERRATVEAARKHRAGLWVLTMLYCGLRPSETAHVLGGDIAGGYLSVRVSKTAAGIRRVPIPAHFAAALEGFGADECVFKQASGRPHTKTSMRQMWGSFKRAVDIELGAAVTARGKVVEGVVAADLTPYCYRHTYCTDLELAGVPINIAKYLMGHTRISTTSAYYTHKTDDALEIARSLIDARRPRSGETAPG